MAILVGDIDRDWRESPDWQLGTPMLVTWEDAEAVIDRHADAMLMKYKVQCERRNTWKTWQLYHAAIRVIAQHRAAAKGLLVANLYPQSRRRRGPRNLIAGRWQPLQGQRWFGIYSGRVAVYRPPGRPALPAAEWVRRYKARQIARRKGTGKARGLQRPAEPYYRAKMRPGVLPESPKYKGQRRRVGELWTRAPILGASVGEIATVIERALVHDESLGQLREEVRADLKSRAPALATAAANLAFAYAAGRGR